LPSFLEPRIFDTILHRRHVGRLRPEDSTGGHYVEHVALPGLTVVHFRTGGWIECQFDLLNIPVGFGRDGLNRRPEVIDHVVVGDNVGDVPGLTIDLNVPTAWLDIAGVARFVPMRKPDKRIGSRSNVIIRVGPG